MSTISADGATQSVYLRQSGADVQYSTDSASWATVSWPATVVNTGASTLEILFTTDLTLNTNDSFFICGTANLQFGSRTLKADGSRPTINIGAGATNYPGLIRNGTSGAAGNDYVYVVNLMVHSDGAVLADDGGWIGQAYFSMPTSGTSRIVNCSSDGTITNGSGGIMGAYFGSYIYAPIITGCSSSGSISGTGAGGIIGGMVTITTTIENSFSSGAISSGGGIIGNNSGSPSGLYIINCYSTGAILNGSGGIVGKECDAVFTVNCYSTGAIDTNSGGIYGENQYGCFPTNCYSFGTIAPGGGGIIGANAGYIIAQHCYSAGACAGGTGGIIAGVAESNPEGSSGNYSECTDGGGSGWNASHAANTLQNIGSTWIAVAADSPYLLLEIGYSPYSLTNIAANYTLNRAASGTVTAGTATAAAVLPTGYTYSIVAINSGNPDVYPSIDINSSTGSISTTVGTAAATYTILVYNVINPYSFSIFTLTVEGSGPEPEPVIAVIVASTCCGLIRNSFSYEIIDDYRIGNRLIVEAEQKPYLRFNDYAEYIKYKMALARKR